MKKKSTRKTGRPRSAFAAKTLDAIGAPPLDDPIRAARWVHRVAIELVWGEMNGSIGQRLAERVRAAINLAVRTLPDDARAALARRIEGGVKGRTGPRPEPLKPDDATKAYRS